MPRKMRNSGHSGPPDRPGTSGFARQSGGELFRRKRVRDLTGHNGGTPRRSLKGVNPLHATISILLISFGLFSVAMIMLNLIPNLWFASLMSMCGSMAVMAGSWMLYDAVTERRSVDNLVRDAVMRALRDRN
jgi:hypothetical protein